mgnify:CR=1
MLTDTFDREGVLVVAAKKDGLLDDGKVQIGEIPFPTEEKHTEVKRRVTGEKN